MKTSLLSLTLATGALASPTYEKSTTYDFIIVGGGTSGLVVASRLSEDPAVSVAVIEAGPSVLNNPNVTSTSGYGLAFGTDIDWAYESVPQPNAGGKPQTLRAAKALGGTSTINGMSYFRAETDQIDAWERMGNVGWNFASLLPYYRKSERLQPPNEQQIAAGASYDPSFHGFDGPITVGWSESMQGSTFSEDTNATNQALGFPASFETNDGSMRGLTLSLNTMDNELDVRQDAARAYYWPHANRTNLHAYLNAFAEKIVWDEAAESELAVAKGVTFTNANGTTQTIFAKKEVILSAGALRSPLILEHSGVGNPSILSQYGIDVKVDLPTVGENLQDQTNSAIAFNTSSTANITSPPTYISYLSASDLYGNETAALNASVYASLYSYAQTVSNATGGVIDVNTTAKLFALQHEIYFNSETPVTEILTIPSSDSISFQYWPLLPFSRGNIHINSSNTSAAAVINPNYFLLDFDSKAHVDTTRMARKIASTAPFSKYVGAETSPGLATLPANATDAQFQETINTLCRSNFHSVGTAAMMSRELGGVVDSTLKVYGTANVRVVDASVMPMQISGHLTATLYAVSERVSDMIKAKYA